MYGDSIQLSISHFHRQCLHKVYFTTTTTTFPVFHMTMALLSFCHYLNQLFLRQGRERMVVVKFYFFPLFSNNCFFTYPLGSLSLSRSISRISFIVSIQKLFFSVQS